MIAGGAIAGGAIAAPAGSRLSILLRYPRTEYYTLVLTGAPDSTTDITLPMSSFQVRLRHGTPTYVSAVIPGVSQAAAVLARPNGKIRITYVALYLDGTSDSLQFAEAGLSEIRTDEGGNNQSISLTGYQTNRNEAPKTITLTDVSYWALSGGKHQARAGYDPNIQPGDTVTCSRGSFVVADVALSASTSGLQMQLSE
jgi:hypothetical protein